MIVEAPFSEHFVRDAQGELTVDGVRLATIAATVGTPAYVYSGAALDGAYQRVDRALAGVPHLIAYAAKANGNLAVLARLARLGAGCDIVSGGELARALRAGMPPSRIVFSGVGKSASEIEAALAAGIRAIHVESVPELDAIEAIAERRGARAPIALRVNPDVDAETHPYIATGLHGTKFGLELDVARALLPRVLGSAHLLLEGVACHIGSQLHSAAPLGEAVEIVARFALECIAAGAPLRSLDAGGGWPIAYGDEETDADPWHEFGAAIRGGLERAGAAALGLEIIVENGRALVGDAGVLLARVMYVKEQSKHGGSSSSEVGPQKSFVVLDAAMTELIRPALYGAYHAIVPVRAPTDDALLRAVDVVGPVCETGDFLALDRPLPPLEQGDLVAIRGAGAYGMSMASQYNARPRAPEVLVEGSSFRVVRERETFDDLMRGETL